MRGSARPSRSGFCPPPRPRGRWRRPAVARGFAGPCPSAAPPCGPLRLSGARRARRSGASPPAARRGSLRAAALRLPRCLGPCPLPGLALRAAAGRPAWVVGPCASPGAAFAPGGPGASLAGRSSLRPGPLRRPAAALRALPSLLPRGRCAGLRPALFRAAPARLWGWGVPPAAAGGVPGSTSLLDTNKWASARVATLAADSTKRQYILLNRQFINKTASRRFSSGAPTMMPHGGSVCTDELSMLLASLHARPLSTKGQKYGN